MFELIQQFPAALDPMTKMWLSFRGIGLMVAAALIVMFARAKTKGFIKVVLMIVATIALLYGVGFSIISII
jgi:Protein of unknown function (DUF2768).